MIERTSALPARTVAILALTVLAFYALLTVTEAWDQLERRGFDTLTVTSARGIARRFPSPSSASTSRRSRRSASNGPGPRSLYAKVVDELARAGALVIVLDIMFSEPSTPPRTRPWRARYNARATWSLRPTWTSRKRRMPG
jgi:adenylate cyclase